MTKKNNIKVPSFRIPHCGRFPNYHLDGVSLREKNLIYLVSVGKEKFEGIWVERFINFIEEIKPKNTIIVVADSLQRFNIEVDENLSNEQALKESKRRGEDWVKNYRSCFFNKNIEHQLIYWDTLKKDKDFEQYMHEIMTLSNDDIKFQAALLNSSKKYIERPSRLSSSNVSDPKKAEKNSCDFLKEECAAFQILAKEKDNVAIVYPGAATEVLALSIAHINKKDYRADNPFYWLDMRRTKEPKKNKKLDIKQVKEAKPINKKTEEKYIKNHLEIQLFRRCSLDGNQPFNMGTSKNQETNLNPSHFFRRYSLDESTLSRISVNSFLI
jgi:hypothetical protein